MSFRTHVLKIVGACGIFGAGVHGNSAAAPVNATSQTPSEPRRAPAQEHSDRSADANPKRLSLRQRKETRRCAGGAENHTDAARQYRTEADRLDAVAAKYEQAADTYGKGQVVNNLMPPTTSQRDAFAAQLLRKAADGLRQRALAEDEAANQAAMAISLK